MAFDLFVNLLERIELHYTFDMVHLFFKYETIL